VTGGWLIVTSDSVVTVELVTAEFVTGKLFTAQLKAGRKAASA
jgi:hypothetical protein